MPERTFVMLKPLGVLHAMVDILKQLNDIGTEVHGEFVTVSSAFMRQHYQTNSHKPYFSDLTDWYEGKTVLGLVYEGEGIIQKVRDLIGPAKPRHANASQIRGQLTDLFPDGVDGWQTFEQLTGEFDNLIHASDSPQEADREIQLWTKQFTYNHEILKKRSTPICTKEKNDHHGSDC